MPHQTPSWPAESTHSQVLRSEEHTSELQSQSNLECRLLLEKNTARGNDASATAWPPGTACVAGPESYQGCCWAVRPCTDSSQRASTDEAGALRYGGGTWSRPRTLPPPPPPTPPPPADSPWSVYHPRRTP